MPLHPLRQGLSCPIRSLIPHKMELPLSLLTYIYQEYIDILNKNHSLASTLPYRKRTNKNDEHR